MHFVINHLTLKEPVDDAVFAAAQAELPEKARLVPGFRGMHVVKLAEDRLVVIVQGDDGDALERLKNEIGSPWMREHIVPLLAEPTQREVGAAVLSIEP